MGKHLLYLFVGLIIYNCCSVRSVEDEHPKDSQKIPSHKKSSKTGKPIESGGHGNEEENVMQRDHSTPNEIKKKLGCIVDKINTNMDEELTLEELEEWIKFVRQKHIQKAEDDMWNEKDIDDGFLTWESYLKSKYCFVDDYNDKSSNNFKNRDKIKRDERRWKGADSNRDGKLDRTEFSLFSHPEEAGHLQHIVAYEMLDDLDKDNDGFISMDEYISDMWPDQDGEEPTWVMIEKEKFYGYRDTNIDGKMDLEEIKDWIVPPHVGIQDEGRRLIYELDSNKNGKLSKDEILDHYDIIEQYDVFVGSLALDLLNDTFPQHDEL